MNLKRRDRWLLVLALLVLMALAALGFGWAGYVMAWIGGLAKAATGAVLAWALGRYLIGIDISAQPDPLTRTIAGLGLCVLIAAGLIAGARAV